MMALTVPLMVLIIVMQATVHGAQTGSNACPNYKTQAVAPLTYTSAGINTIKARLGTGGAFVLFAADEETNDYASNCYVLSPKPIGLNLNFTLNYYKAGVKQTPANLTFDRVTGDIFGKLTAQTLGSWDATLNVNFTLVLDTNRTLIFKSCHPGFLSHQTRTYAFVDNRVDICNYDHQCLLEKVSTLAKVKLYTKGVCGCPA